MNRDAEFLPGIKENVAQVGTDRVGKGNMDDDTVAEEGARSPLCPVEELVGNHDMSGMNILPHAPDRADRDKPFHTELFHAVDIGPEIELGREYPVPFSVPRQKGDVNPFE